MKLSPACVAVALMVPLFARAQSVEFADGERLSVVSKRAATGTHLSRAYVDERPIANKALRDVIERAVAEPLKSCPEAMRADLRIVIREKAMPDRIGQTNQRLAGAGLYVSLPESGYDGMGNWYLAPFASQTVELHGGGSRLATAELQEYSRHEFNRDLLGSMDFLRIDQKSLVDAVEPFLRAQYAKVGAELAGQGCKR